MSKKQSQEQSNERIYDGKGTIESDLFRLQLSDALKNMALPDSGAIEIEKVPHVHFFRTYDSDGKKHAYSVPVAGHFHEVKYEETADGHVKIISCSGPLTFAKKKIKGIPTTVAIPANPHPEYEDNHTHEIVYIKSQKIEARIHNANAAQFMGNEAQKSSSIPGIVG